jgi:tRNA threonylcarbamoyladenosine dehydratase
MTNALNSERFDRTKLLLGDEAFGRLAAARVVVVGLGAVGSYAVEGVARAGVGAMRLVDFDVIRPSNINRQLYALDSTEGRPKVDVAADRVRDINPACRIETLQVFLDLQTLPQILAGQPDVVIDAIDGVGPKVILIQAAVGAGLKVVSAMGAALHKDPRAIRVDDLSKTKICPLARLIRKRLGMRGIKRGVRCVYSIEEVPHVQPLEDEEAAEKDFYERGRKRTPLGSLSTVTGLFGLTAAHEAIRLIADRAS